MTINIWQKAISFSKYYLRCFIIEVRYAGFLSAFRKAIITMKSFKVNKTDNKIDNKMDYKEYNYLPELETQGCIVPNMVMIISNTQIEQCITYRINQKISVLKDIGIPSKTFDPTDVGRIKSFLPFAATIIIFRTAVRDELIMTLRESNARLIF